LCGSAPRKSVSGMAILLCLALAGRAHAQDQRNVLEPVIPAVCQTLSSSLAAIENHTTLADSDEQKPDTARIQQAIDACPPGRAVELQSSGSHDAFLAGPLQLRAGVTLLVDANTILFASRNARDYDVAPAACGVVDHNGHGCRGLINADHAANAGVEGSGTIDGRGWAKLTGQRESWWQLAEDARTGDRSQNCPRLLQLTHADNFTLYRITLKNSPNFHVAYTQGNGFTVWGIKIDTPKKARNTDGIDPISSRNVTITRSYIQVGDDNVAIKAGDLGPSANITLSNNHFYAGHGMSVGSETNGGVSAVRVTDLTIDGADNGIRIKSNSSRGGLVHDVVYRNICIRDTKNPIVMDTNYSFYSGARDRLPVFTGIAFHDVRVFGGGKFQLQGYDAIHRLGIRFDDVAVEPFPAVKISAAHADIALGPGSVNFMPVGDDVHVTGKPRPGAANICASKFVPLPVD
jgi:polygalacturonase